MATAFKTVAKLADFSGMYRVSFSPATRAYGSWAPEHVADHCARQQLPTKGVTVTDEEWEEISRGEWNGYSSTSDLEAPVIRREWVPLA